MEKRPNWKPANCGALEVRKDNSIFGVCLSYYFDGLRDEALQSIVLRVSNPRPVEIGHLALGIAAMKY